MSKLNKQNYLIDLLAASDAQYAFDKTFTRPVVKEICGAAGIPVPWGIFTDPSVTKLARGVYQYTGLTTPTEKVKKTTKREPEVVQLAQVIPLKPVRKEQVSKNDMYAQVPEKDLDYIPFGDYKDIEQIIKSELFYPVLITGHSGNGKTMTIEQACAKLKRPLIRINCTKKTDEEVLIGTKTLIDGDVVIVEGPLLIAMRSGSVILLDEFSCSDPNAILCIQGIMEGKPFYFPLTGEYITPKKGFNVFLTDNTKGQGSDDGRYVGTNILNEAFLERIGMNIEQEYPPLNIERKIVLRRMDTKGCVDEVFAEDLVKWAEAIRRTFADGGIDSVISTRRLGHIVDNFSIFKDKKKAIVQCTNRFDEMTKMAFVALFDKIATVDLPSVDTPAPVNAGNTDFS